MFRATATLLPLIASISCTWPVTNVLATFCFHAFVACSSSRVLACTQAVQGYRESHANDAGTRQANMAHTQDQRVHPEHRKQKRRTLTMCVS